MPLPVAMSVRLSQCHLEHWVPGVWGAWLNTTPGCREPATRAALALLTQARGSRMPVACPAKQHHVAYTWLASSPFDPPSQSRDPVVIQSIPSALPLKFELSGRTQVSGELLSSNSPGQSRPDPPPYRSPVRLGEALGSSISILGRWNLGTFERTAPPCLSIRMP